MAKVTRKKGESFESMLRRFGRCIQYSGKLLQAKKIRFFSTPKSKHTLRESALHRIKTREKREYLIRSGKMKEEDFAGRGRFRRK